MNKEFDIESLVSGLDFSTNHLVDCGNGLMLTNGEIDVLKRFGIDFKKCSSLKQIICEIEEVFNTTDSDDLEDLDYIASTIAERDYYQNTNK